MAIPRPRSASRLGTLPLLLITLVVAGAASADQPATDTDFGEVIDVQLVNVEVWVTDRDGEPVRGLTAEDFEIQEDGDAVEIAFFDEVRTAPGAHLSRAAATDDDDTSASEETPAAPSNPAHLVAYFDLNHLTKSGLQQAVSDLRELFDSGRVPVDRVLILRQDQSLAIEASFGSDRKVLDAALDRLAEASPGGQALAQERVATLLRLQQLWQQAQFSRPTGSTPGGASSGGTAPLRPPACETFGRGARAEIVAYGDISRDRIETTLDHLWGISGFLAGVPGVKGLLYLSDSLEIEPGSALGAYVDGFCPGLGREIQEVDRALDMSDGFRSLARHAAAQRITLYGVLAGGLQGDSSLSAQVGSTDPRSSQRFQASLRDTERAGLLFLASETGGRVLRNQNRFADQLQVVADELGSYYSIAYRPLHGGDGREHRIDVDLARSARSERGIEVRHRKGYRDKSSDERLSEGLQGALFMGLGVNPLGVRLGAGDPAQSGTSYALPLHVYVPASSVTFVPTEGDAAAEIAKVKVMVAWRSGGGENPSLEQKIFQIRGPVSGEGQFLDLQVPIRLEGGAHAVAVAVRDEVTREFSFVSTALAFPEIQVGSGAVAQESEAAGER